MNGALGSCIKQLLCARMQNYRWRRPALLYMQSVACGICYVLFAAFRMLVFQFLSHSDSSNSSSNQDSFSSGVTSAAMAQEKHFMYFGVWSTQAFYIAEFGHEQWQLFKAQGLARAIVEVWPSGFGEGVLWFRMEIAQIEEF